MVLKPKISVLDGLNVSSRLELYPSNKDALFHPSPLNSVHRSFGLPLFYAVKGEMREELPLSPLFFDISQLYINYETEFFQLQGGRSPRHFGLGITYNSGENDPFNHWVTTLTQFFFYTEYGPLYVQPALIVEKSHLLGFLQGGIDQDSWKAEAFYRYNTGTSESYLEIFGEYKKNPWEARLSFSYPFTDTSAFGLAFEGEIELPWTFNPKAQVKGGMAARKFSFHPGYDVSLLFQNYNGQPKLPQDKPNQLLIQEGVLQDVIYFSPQVEMSLSKNLKITPLILLAWLSEDNKMSYELDIKGQYDLEERFIITLKGGVLYKEKWDFGLLSQAAVTF